MMVIVNQGKFTFPKPLKWAKRVKLSSFLGRTAGLQLNYIVLDLGDLRVIQLVYLYEIIIY